MNADSRAQRIAGHLRPALVSPAEGPLSGADALALNALFGTVRETERNGGELVAEVLHAHGVKFLFTLSGGHISPILVASKQKGIRVVDVRHEVTSVFAADAVARLSGVPGVATVTAGPGITNTITAVKNAQMAQSPVVLLGGAAATLLKGRGALQDIDQMSVLRPIVKFAASVTRVCDIVPVLRQAFAAAMSGVPGPVFVEFPLDVLYPIAEVRASMGFSRRVRARDVTPAQHSSVIVPEEWQAKGVAAYLASKRPDAPVFLESGASGQHFIVDAYMKYQLASLFAGAFDNNDYSPLPVTIPMPAHSDIHKAVELLKGASTPVMLIGSQATLLVPQIDALRAAVEALGIPTFLGGMARGLLGRNNPIHIRQNRGHALKNADVVILLGAVTDFRMDYGRVLSKKSAVIAVNRSREDLFLNSPMFWKPTLASNADPCTFLLQLAAHLGNSCAPKYAGWARKLKDGEQKKEAENEAKSTEPAFGRGTKQEQAILNPLDLVHQLEHVLPDNAILVADGGDFVATASYVLRPRGPLRWLDPGAFGTLGVGGGFALGAKLCRPESEVYLIWGDGSSGYSIAEFDTMKRHNIPVIAVIGNDACWTQIEREQVPMFGDDVACPLDYCAYETVAKGYGGEGLTVSKSEDVKEVLQRARQLVQTGPVVINALIGKTNFREGSLSV